MGITANVVADAPILASWGNEIRDRSVQNFASAAERAAQWTAPPEGALSFLRDSNQLHVYNGAWICITPVHHRMTTSTESRTNITYGDLPTPGPTVTLYTANIALVTISASIDNAGGSAIVYAAIDVTGATTLAATDSNAYAVTGPTGVGVQGTSQIIVPNLTPGVNTFTVKYRASAGTISVSRRQLIVVGIP